MTKSIDKCYFLVKKMEIKMFDFNSILARYEDWYVNGDPYDERRPEKEDLEELDLEEDNGRD